MTYIGMRCVYVCVVHSIFSFTCAKLRRRSPLHWISLTRAHTPCHTGLLRIKCFSLNASEKLQKENRHERCSMSIRLTHFLFRILRCSLISTPIECMGSKWFTIPKHRSSLVVINVVVVNEFRSISCLAIVFLERCISNYNHILLGLFANANVFVNEWDSNSNSLNNNKTIESIHNTNQKQIARQAHEPWIGCASCIPHRNELTNTLTHMCKQLDISTYRHYTFKYMPIFFIQQCAHVNAWHLYLS